MIDLWRIEDNRLLEPSSTIVADNVGPLFDSRRYLSYVWGNDAYDSRYVETRLEYQDDLVDGLEVSVWRGVQMETDGNFHGGTQEAHSISSSQYDDTPTRSVQCPHCGMASYSAVEIR